MAPLTHPSIKNGVFSEDNSQWPFVSFAMTLKVKEILHVEKSQYQDVLVFASETYGNVLVLDGVIQVTERDEFSYQEMITHLPMASHPNPKDVLVIGGGDGGVIREVLKHSSVERVTLCDIDEAVVRVSKLYLPHMSHVYSDPRVTVFIGDGFKFLPEHEDEYDVIITDSSDPVGPAAALFEAPYFTLLRNALKAGGNMSTQGECIWLHLPLIRELRETTKRLFPVADYAFTTIPTYPSGQIGFVICSKEAGRSMSTPLREVPDCKYYNNKVHSASFVLPEFARAMLDEGKDLRPTFAGVRPGVKKDEDAPKGKSVLLLGSGLVAAPAAEYITRQGHSLTIACRTLATAQALCGNLPNASPMVVDVTNQDSLNKAVADHDLVVSLIPYTYHTAVIEAAIAGKVNVVTTSYASPAMNALDQRCKDAGIIVYNEVGLDPGVDHFWAIKTIDEVHKKGGKILEFESMCGGLAAPVDANNALGYRFSWSPRGVLLALQNNAKFIKDGKAVEVPGEKLMSSAKPYYFSPPYNLVCYPNRDSSVYRELYNIPEANYVIRGTMRYAGFPAVVAAWVDMGFLNSEPKEWLAKDAKSLTWLEVTAKAVGTEASEDAVIAKLNSFESFKSEGPILINKLKELGLLSSDKAELRGSVLDTLCARLEKECPLEAGMADLVLLRHTFKVEWANGKKNTITASMERYGSNTGGPSAMAYTVGVPCGIAVQLIFDGKVGQPGINVPYNERDCAIFREECEKEGITMVEKMF